MVVVEHRLFAVVMVDCCGGCGDGCSGCDRVLVDCCGDGCGCNTVT